MQPHFLDMCLQSLLADILREADSATSHNDNDCPLHVALKLLASKGSKTCAVLALECTELC